MELPEINKRIKDIIDIEANSNVKKFAEKIGIQQQKLNRLFNLDSRTDKYPTVTIDIVVAITEMYVNYSTDWILTGKGDMYKTTLSDTNQYNKSEAIELLRELLREKEDKIDRMNIEIGTLRRDIEALKKSNYTHGYSIATEPELDYKNEG